MGECLWSYIPVDEEGILLANASVVPPQGEER